MANATRRSEPDLAKQASRNFAAAFQAYMECCSEVQTAIREMSAITNDPDADEDEREMAISTIAEALFPRHHSGRLGIAIEAWDRLDARRSAADVHELDLEEETFAERVASILRERAMSQAQLAEAIGIGQPAVSMMLSRKSRPQARTIRKIAAALQIPAAELWPDLREEVALPQTP